MECAPILNMPTYIALHERERQGRGLPASDEERRELISKSSSMISEYECFSQEGIQSEESTVAKPSKRPPKPTGRNPVIAGRVPRPLHEKIKRAAKISGRSMSEELAFHAEECFRKENICDKPGRREIAALVSYLSSDLARIKRVIDTGPLMLSALKAAYRDLHRFGALSRRVAADAIRAADPKWKPPTKFE